MSLIAGVALIVILDTTFAYEIHAGQLYSPAWISYAIPIAATIVWLIVAAANVRQLARLWWQARFPSKKQPSPPTPPTPQS